ncbi:Tyrosine-protein phosphatase MSG5 [Yarrowia lipolytica]|nr:Tyrosine-protein phosphatase MSG5 [Yarrowia lipolytica]
MNCSVADMAGSHVPSNHHHPQAQQIHDPDAMDSLPAPPRRLPFRPPKGKNSNTKNLSLMVPQGSNQSHNSHSNNNVSPPHTSIEPSIAAPLPFVLPVSSMPVRASAPSVAAASPLAASFSLGLSRKGSVKRSHVDAEPEDAAYDSDYRSEHKNYHSRTSPKRQSPSPQVQPAASATVSSVPPFSMEPPPFTMQRRTSQLSISIPLATCSGSNTLPAPLGTPTSQSHHSANSAASQLSLSDSESDPNSDNTTHTTPPPNYDDALPPSKHHLFAEELMTPSVHHENAYPDGPLLIYPSNVYLYSEPSVELARTFDVVINVAKEIDNPFSEEQYANDGQTNPEYVYVPWGHNSKFLPDLPYLTQLIDDRSAAGKRVLVHCQCGVSRSASLLIAYIMKKQQLDLNAAYDWVKYRSPEIGPNMTLIFQLMDWHKHLLGEKDALESDED